jgi:hypothetical protein
VFFVSENAGEKIAKGGTKGYFFENLLKYHLYTKNNVQNANSLTILIGND